MKGKIRETVRVCRTDVRYRAGVMLRVNLVINCAYGVFEAVCGYLFRSAWMGTLAFYYMLLSFMRFHVLRSGRYRRIRRRWKAYRTCGIIMLLLTVAAAGIHILTMEKYYAIRYPGYMIYAVALYTFYATVNAVRNVIVCRRMNDPAISAGKAINLSVAAISMYNLQSAMITAFGDSDEEFRIIMGNCVGTGVLAVILCISIVMILRANRAMRGTRDGWGDAA